MVCALNPGVFTDAAGKGSLFYEIIIHRMHIRYLQRELHLLHNQYAKKPKNPI